MSDVNNIVSEFIYIPELMGKEISKLIKNKQKINEYYNNGYKIEINNDDAHLIIKYKKKKYDVFIVKDDDNYYWLLKPYNQSYYKTYVDFDNSNIDIVFFAIRENEDLYS